MKLIVLFLLTIFSFNLSAEDNTCAQNLCRVNEKCNYRECYYELYQNQNLINSYLRDPEGKKLAYQAARKMEARGLCYFINN